MPVTYFVEACAFLRIEIEMDGNVLLWSKKNA